MQKQDLISMSLIEESVGDKMNDLMKLCFKANAVCDVIAVRLDTQFAMPKAADIFHHTIAHAFPIIFADAIGEYLNKRNYPLYYGNIERIDFVHDNVEEYFKEFIRIMYDINECINEATAIAEQYKDYSAIDFLGGFQSGVVNLYTKQAFILYNSAIQEKHNLGSFNSHFDDIIIVKSEEED